MNLKCIFLILLYKFYYDLRKKFVVKLFLLTEINLMKRVRFISVEFDLIALFGDKSKSVEERVP